MAEREFSGRFGPGRMTAVAACAVVLAVPMLVWAEEDESESNLRKASEYLQNLAEGEREKKVATMNGLIDDIDRVCGLEEGQRQTLEVAAKGAVDRGLTQWRERMEQSVRHRLENAAGREEWVLQELVPLRSTFNQHWQPGTEAIWRDALESVLSDDQRRAFREDAVARRKFKNEALAGMLVADLDQQLRFSIDQREATRRLVLEAVESYAEKFELRYGSHDSLPHVSQVKCMLGAVSGEALVAVLTEEQLGKWETYFRPAEGMWNAIRNLEGPDDANLWFE